MALPEMTKHKGFPSGMPGTGFQFTLRRANPKGATKIIERKRYADRAAADGMADAAFLHSLWQHFENFAMKMIGIIIVLLSPLLLYEKFVDKVSSEKQLFILIPLIIISVGIVIYWMNKNGEIGWNKKVESEINSGKAQVLKIETEKGRKLCCHIFFLKH